MIQCVNASSQIYDFFRPVVLFHGVMNTLCLYLTGLGWVFNQHGLVTCFTLHHNCYMI